MRKQYDDTEPFEVIEDAKGRYTSAVDLVRPDSERERHFQVPVKLLIWIGVVLIVGAAFALPAIDREMMRRPLVETVNALNAGSAARLRANFTADARVKEIPATYVLDAVEPFMRMIHNGGTLRFTGLEKVKRAGKNRYEADFTVTYYLDGDDSLPYERIPVHKTGHVTLQHVGMFRWRIADLSSDEEEFQQAMSALKAKWAVEHLFNGSGLK